MVTIFIKEAERKEAEFIKEVFTWHIVNAVLILTVVIMCLL